MKDFENAVVGVKVSRVVPRPTNIKDFRKKIARFLDDSHTGKVSLYAMAAHLGYSPDSLDDMDVFLDYFGRSARKLRAVNFYGHIRRAPIHS